MIVLSVHISPCFLLAFTDLGRAHTENTGPEIIELLNYETNLLIFYFLDVAVKFMNVNISFQ